MSIHAIHDALEIEVCSFFESLGFLTEEATYHAVMSQPVKERLTSIYEPTSLYIRGRADRIAVHKTYQLVWEWEAKTHNPGPYHDMVIELLPMLHHLKKAELGVRCLYAYRDTRLGIDAGFWTDSLPEVREVFLTPRFHTSLLDVVLPQVKRYMPNARIEYRKATRGSNDPFLIIDQQTICSLPSWQQLITSELYQHIVTL